MTVIKKMSLLPFIYLIFGVYFLSFGLDYLSVPEFISQINNWIIFSGGVLFLVAAYRSIIYSKERIARRLIRAHR